MSQLKQSVFAHASFKLVAAFATLLSASVLSATASYSAVGANELPTGFSTGDVGTSENTVGNNMTVTQNNNRTVIDWQTFNIGSNASVNFNQQSTSSVAINRVLNSSIGSEIHGALSANGKIVILDRNGVMFGSGATINVGGIIASTGELDAANQTAFLSGSNSFQLSNIDAETGASVINNATNFTVHDSGLAAFVAPYVYNNGVINAKVGKVTLAAGKKVTVDFTGDELIQIAADQTLANALVENAGTINAQGGTVTMTARAAANAVTNVVNMKGVINATAFGVHNGKIVLSNKGGKVIVDGTLDVSRGGDQGGSSAGEVSIYGDDVIFTAAARILANMTTVETPIFQTVPVYDNSYSYTYVRTTRLFPKRTESVTIISDTLQGLINQLPGDNILNFGAKLVDTGKILFQVGVSTIQVQTGTETIQTGTQVDKGNGNGGNVSIDADNSLVFASGAKIELRGGELGGNGGTASFIAGNSISYFGLVDASAPKGSRGSVLIDPAVLTVSNAVAGDIVNTTALNNTLNLANVHLLASEQIRFLEAADFGTAAGHLTVEAPRLSFLGNFITRSGGVTFTGGSTVDLGGKLYTKGMIFNTLMSESDLDDMASTVNILGNGASIMQGQSLAANGAVINVASGTYNETLDIYKSLALYGTNASIFSNNFLAPASVKISANDVTFDGFSVSGLNGSGISATGVTGLTVSNNKLTGYVLGTAIRLNGVSNSSVTGNTVTASASAIGVTGGDDLSITGNTITGVNTGIALAHSTDATIGGNIITGTLGDAINASYADGLSLTGNIIAGVVGGNGITVSETDGLTATLNAIVGIPGVSQGNGFSFSNVSNAQVFLNAVGGMNGHALTGTGVSDANIFLNAFGLNGGDGINLSNALDTHIFLNLIGGNGGNGVTIFGSSDIDIFLNAILSTGGTGVAIAGTDDANIFLNYINGTGNDGILAFDSDGVAVFLNAIESAGGNGISVVGSDDALVIANQVSGSYLNGVSINGGDNAAVLLNRIDGTTYGNGIGIDGTTNTLVTLNDISGTGGSGIAGYNASGLKIIGNRVSGAASNGIDLYDTDGVLVTLNEVTGTNYNGINLASTSGAIVLLNHVDGTTIGNGISVDGGAFNLITLNKIDNAAADGIRVSDSDASFIIANKVTDAGGNGVSVDMASGVLVLLNHITGSGADGIKVTDSGNVAIWFNRVSGSVGNGISVSGNYEGEEQDGGDYETAFLSYIVSEDIPQEETPAGAPDNISILGNKVTDSGQNGIQAANVWNLDILLNRIDGTGEGNGVLLSDVRDVDIKLNKISNVASNGIDIYNGDTVDVAFNKITDVAYNGIYASSVDGFSARYNYISGGDSTGIYVENSPYAFIRRNYVHDFANGIYAGWNSGGSLISGNRVDNIAYDGIASSYVDEIYIDGNTVTNYGQDGVQVSNAGYASITGNTIDAGTYTGDRGYNDFYEGEGDYGSQTTGIRIGGNQGKFIRLMDYGFDDSGVDYVYAAGNTVSNNDVGFRATAFNNGFIGLYGNTFNDNETGLYIGSGLVDLTGETNTFNGGRVAMIFERQSYTPYGKEFMFLYEGEQEGEFEVVQEDIETIYSDLALVDDTLGTTVFNGQTANENGPAYYVELRNGAFFAPGTPTIIDGTQATYDGVFGGLMTPEQLRAIEDMILDYDDDRSLGQIFAGFATLDDNQILKKIQGNGYKAGKAAIIINNTPNAPASGTGNRFFSIQDLANLEPAAGGEDPTGADLNDMEPAAGDGAQNGECWANAAGMGGVVSLDLSGDESSLLGDMSGCQGDI
jgi:filamentous hemagglutinin family protein